MGPVRVLILTVATVSAVGAALIVRSMAKGQEASRPAAVVAAAAPNAAPQKPLTQVLVAKHDLAPGVTVQAVDVDWQAWPLDSVNPAFIVKASTPTPANATAVQKAVKTAATAAEMAKTAASGPEGPEAALIGAMVREKILAGEPMVESKLVRAGTAGVLAVTLDPGMRAMAVPLSAESAAGGFILPGDHVDVVQSRQLDAGTKRFVSSTVMRNVRVLAIDQNTGAPKGAAVVGATATLEVSPGQAETLVLAKAQGELTLVLRSYADFGGPTLSVARADSGSGGGGGGQPAVVRVFRNAAATEVSVSR